VVNFPEKPETVREDLREIAPQVLLFSSRLWENVASMVQMKISESSALNRFFYNLLLPIGYKVADMRFRKEEPNLFWKALYALADLVMFRPLRDKIGLLKVRAAYTAGAALNPDVLRFFQAIGVNLKQLFGSTEAIIHTLHRDDDIKVETVGPPVPGVKVAISEEGEILVKSDAVFCGYYKNPDATRKALKDGWFHTGDAGYFDDDGHLIYLDRVKDLLELAGGAKFSPQYIEGKLKFSPYIRDTMVVGGKDKAYVTAIVNIDFDNVGEWAEKHHIAYTTFVDLSQKPEVYDLIRKDVERVNSILPPPARVRKFVLLHKEFDPDEAELTRTRKLRRTFMESRYQNIIEAMYGDRDRVMVQAEVKYRDGRTGVVETAVKIYSLDEEVAT
jgi:long-chain acyl-CoA synthetase